MRIVTRTGRYTQSRKYGFSGNVYVLPDDYEISEKVGERPFEVGKPLYKQFRAERVEWIDSRSRSGKHGGLDAVSLHDLPDGTRLWYSFIKWKDGYPDSKLEGEFSGVDVSAHGYAIWNDAIDFELEGSKVKLVR